MNYQDGYSQKALDALAKGKYKSLRSSGLANYRYTEGKKKRDNIAVAKQNKKQNPTPRNTNAMANDPRFSLPSVSLPVPTLPMLNAMQGDPRFQRQPEYNGDEVLNQLLGGVKSSVKESPNLSDMIPGNDKKVKSPKKEQKQTDKVAEIMGSFDPTTPVKVTKPEEKAKKRSMVKPATRYKNEPAMQKTELPQRDTTYDKEFAEYWDARFANHDIRDYDPETDRDIPHWQNVKKDIMQKHGWTEEEFEKNFTPYNAEQWTKMSEDEVQGNIGAADKSAALGALLNTMYLPQAMVEGASGIISNLTGYENPDFVGSDPYVATRSREGMKTAATKDMGTVGSTLYNIGLGQLDRAVASQIPILGTAALGAETAARTLLNDENRGVDDKKAALQALGSGIASGFFNRIGFNKMAEGGSSPIGNILKGAAAEGAEEGAEELFNIGLDTGLNLDKSELATLHDYYVSQGMSNGQAWLQVAKDKGIDLATSIGTGALFGGLFSAANEVPELKTRLSNVITEKAKDAKYDANQARVPDVVEQARAQAERAQAEIERLNEQLPEMPEAERAFSDMSPEEQAALQAELDNEYNFDVNEVAANDTGIESNPRITESALPNRWGRTADSMIAEDSYARNADFRKLEEDIRSYSDQIEEVRSQRRALEDTLEKSKDSDIKLSKAEVEELADVDDPTAYLVEKTGLSEEEINALDAEEFTRLIEGKRISVASGDVSQLKEQISVLDNQEKELRRQQSLVEEDRDYIKADARLSQLENYTQNEFIPATREKYQGFSTTKGEHNNEIGKGARLVEMSPDEYLQRCALEIFNKETSPSTLESMLSSREQANVDKYAQMMREGVEFDTPYLNYTSGGYGGQEGIHRALAAKEAGIDVMPVVVKGNPESPDSLGYNARKRKGEIELARLERQLPDDVIEESIVKSDIDILDDEDDLKPIEELNNTGIDNRVPTAEQTPVETNQVPAVVNPGITNVPPTDVGNTESGNGRHTKTSETYINTGRYGGGWTEEEYNQKTDPSQFQYEDVGERESLEKGFGMIRDEGFDEFRDRVMDKERLSGAEIDGLMAEWRIINDNARRLEAEGKDASDVWSEGIKVFRKIQEQSTSNAQALQALAKWSRNTPEGLLTEAENIINGKKKMNEPDKSDIQKQFEKFAKGNKKFKFSDDFVSDFLNKAQELEGLDNESREAKEIMAELGKMINRQLPAKFTEKLTSYLMDSMLGNFRTLITRNAGGNIGLNAVEQFAQRPLAALIDMGVSKKTGRRTQAGLSGKGLAEYVSGFAKGLKEEAIDFKKDLHTARSGENTLANAVSQNRHVFKEKGVMDRLDKLVKHGLSVGDRPFYEAVYKQTLGDYQRLRDSGKMGDTIQSLSDEDFDMYSKIAAKTNALSAVYQQDSKLSNALLKFKNAVGDLSEGIVGVDILSQFSMPFVKTPANVIERSIDYSPLGLVRNAIRTGKELKSEGGLDQNRFANETARNILGTGLMAGSAALAAKGGMSGGYSEDRDEKQAQKESGMQEYALNLGDGKQMDIGWIPVVGGNAVAAAAAVDAYKNGEGNVLGNLARGAEAGGQALFDQSMFQGLQRLFGTGESYDSDSSIFGNMANVVKSGVGQAIPSIIRQMNQVADPYQRDVGNSNEGVSFGMFDNYDLNSLANNVPFLRQMGLAPKVNTSGELVRENQGRNIGSKILEDMILPGRVSKVDVSPLNQEAERLQEATTSSDAYMPKASRKYVDTAEHTLTNQEWTDYQQNYYGSMTEVGNKLMESDAYKSADPDEQVQMLKAGYDAIRYALQSEYSGKEVSGAAKAYEEAGGGEEGINAVIDSVTASHNPYGLDSNEYKDALEKGEDLSSLEGYKETLAENGMTNSKANQQAYKEGGAQALKTKGDIETFFHDNYGLDAPGVSSAWQNTKREFPMITEDQFNRQYRDIAGQEGDLMSISMNEIINYITNHPNEYKVNGEYDMPKVNQLWRAYKGDNWKQVPYVKKDGSLGHHKQ